jgi:hypothetical protein
MPQALRWNRESLMLLPHQLLVFWKIKIYGIWTQIIFMDDLLVQTNQT